MERITKPQGISSCSSVVTARTPPRGSGSRRLRTTRRPVTGPSPSPRISTGERQKRSSIRCDFPVGRLVANSRNMATFRRTVGEASSDSSHAALCGSSSSSAGSTTTSALASSPSSRSSGFVNAACAGPATAEDDHFGDRGAGERLDRVVGGVGRSELVRLEHQHPRDIDRDIPVADDDGACARQVGASSAYAGWPLYQATNSVAATDPGRSSPGIPSRLSVGVPTA